MEPAEAAITGSLVGFGRLLRERGVAVGPGQLVRYQAALAALDRADDEFEAFLLELLSDFQITIPEIGTIAAGRPPLVVLTSNRTRELHDALKRRCLYHWIGYPELEREVEIVRLRASGLPEPLVREVVAIVGRLRELDLAKAPGVAETINWARALGLLGVDRLDPDAVAPTLGSVLKDRDDLLRVHAGLEELLAHGAR